MHYVYILELQNSRYYIGSTKDLKQRVTQHKNSSVFTTKNGKVKDLIFYSAFKSIQKARAFEKYLKTSSGFAFRNKRLI